MPSTVEKATLPPPFGKPQTEVRISPTVAQILFGLEKRGLSIRLNDIGDGLKLSGPEEERTDQIRAVLKSAKPELIAYLTEKHRADLVAEFGEDLIADGEAADAAAARSDKAEVVEILKVEPIGSTLPASERQARPLLQPDHKAAVPDFPLPEVIYHPDPATFWREWKKMA